MARSPSAATRAGRATTVNSHGPLSGVVGDLGGVPENLRDEVARHLALRVAADRRRACIATIVSMLASEARVRR